MKIAILSNINVDTLIRRISKKHEVYLCNGYGNWVRELIDLDSRMYSFAPENVFLLLDGEELFKEINSVEMCENEVKSYFDYIENSIKSNPSKIYFVSNIDLPHKKIQSLKETRVERFIEYLWYKNLCRLNDEYDNFYIFDLKKIIEELGRNKFYSSKLWYLAGIKFSALGEKLIQKEIEKYIYAQKSKKKALILDLDNTLWGGVIGEVGIEGVSLSDFKEGARYRDFQKRIKEMKNLGVILMIVSKNNYEDAIEMFEKHPNMVLSVEDFAAVKINWNLKSQNIIELSQELNIGLDSMVFIDDSPIERENVSSMVSQVDVPEFPSDTSKLEEFINKVYFEYFFTLNTLDEDKNKTKMYRENFEREKAKKNAISLSEFLQNLQTKIIVSKAGKDDVLRISQLTQKTNQFNLTTRRYSSNDIKKFINSSDYDVYVITVKDKFGDNGKVSVVIVKKDENKIAYLDTFLLSCRVMGRNIENDIISYIEEKLSKEGYRRLYAYYIPTLKNKPVENLFEKLGYTLIEKSSDEIKKYYIDLKDTIRRENSYSELIEK
ncbi:hypothetical protein CLTEP_12760 [Clostridium tepidiprofundi DSM 19306]|uniref:Uncharacterized protein n=1 Tax=Clostridium tepidiprofundi DSM 19306 TaxID=1121338 RepID=A0A151B4G2_9CLOT|nr:HAD-IIIC family phosphatase [Clostridium tepidiprofundi]KYH34811.1 hypothetical protein CLTEP_12760 [Clostridium tepidiprofundi DSM 19306]